MVLLRNEAKCELNVGVCGRRRLRPFISVAAKRSNSSLYKHNYRVTPVATIIIIIVVVVVIICEQNKYAATFPRPRPPRHANFPEILADDSFK